jgi:hypothetical protein
MPQARAIEDWANADSSQWEAKSFPVYSNADLDSTYSIHDLFAQLDGAAAYRVGLRQYDGVDTVAVL